MATALNDPFSFRLQQRLSGISEFSKDNEKNDESEEIDPFLKRQVERKSIPQEEDYWTDKARTALQVPQGYLEGTVPGLISGGLHFLGMGEALDPEEIERIEQISRREGIPFDEEKYKKSAQNALDYFPTVGNIGRIIEEQTGVPLTAKTNIQKNIRMGSTAGKAIPGTLVQKSTAAVLSPASKEALLYFGVPESFAEIGGFAIGGSAAGSLPGIELNYGKTKSSGIKTRGFESLKDKTYVSENKLSKINSKIEKDFKKVSEKIIKDSPIGQTYENLKKDHLFKKESRELMKEAQQIADTLPGSISKEVLEKEFANKSSQEVEGFSLSEYDKEYLKNMKEGIDSIKDNEISAAKLVQQYRKNNSSLSESFEPGSSKALNRAKKDAILTQNRIISDIIDKYYPDSNLSSVFKEGNSRWTKIMDSEFIDSFVTDLFDGKINHKNIHDVFDKNGYSFKFKRALGQEGYLSFENLLTDMLENEHGYNMLQIAKENGWSDLVKTGGAYMLHPKIGLAKTGLVAAKKAYKFLSNTMLDKPQIGLKLKKSIDDIKFGKFESADKGFKYLQKEIKKTNH